MPALPGILRDEFLPMLRKESQQRSKTSGVCSRVHACLCMCACVCDIVVFYPVQPSGRGVYLHGTHEERKYKTYPQTVAGRRIGAPPRIPLVVSTFGVLNELAVSYLDAVDGSAVLKGRL